MNYGFRYVSVLIGRWFRRDPLGEIAGLNPYRCASNSLINYFDFLGLDYFDFLGLQEITLPAPMPRLQWYYKVWLAEHPDMNRSLIPGFQGVLKAGCIGVVGLRAGKMNMGMKKTLKDLGSHKCFKTRAQAEEEKRLWIQANRCCPTGRERNISHGKAAPFIFSIHLWDSSRDEQGNTIPGEQPEVFFDDADQAYMGNWDMGARKTGYGPFDFAYVDDKNHMVGANNAEPEFGGPGPMMITTRTMKDWSSDVGTKDGYYNIEVWCVACDKVDAF